MDQLALCQHKFWSLARYYGRGDFHLLESLIQKAGYQSVVDSGQKFANFNLLNALQIGGVIDILESETSSKWTWVPSERIEIQSTKPKEVFIHGVDQLPQPLVVDHAGTVLLCGGPKQVTSFSSKAFGFDSSLIERFGPIGQLVDRISFEEAMPEVSNGNFEFFDLAKFSWRSGSECEAIADMLVRIPGEFSGREYKVLFQSLRLCFRIVSPEWAMVAAAFLLNWPLGQVLKYRDGNLSYPTRFRIPIVFRRFLFANSNLGRIGSTTSFEGVEPAIANLFLSFLTDGRITYES